MTTHFPHLGLESRLFFGYVLLVFRPGSSPPQHPQSPPQTIELPEYWDNHACQLFIDEARRDMDQQQADKRDIRARAQQVFTTTLVLGAAIGASYTNQNPHRFALVAYILAALMAALGGLSSAGIITAKALIGAPNLANLARAANSEVDRKLAIEYAASRHVGAATVAVLVTVLRDAVLTLVVAFLLFACGHICASI